MPVAPVFALSRSRLSEEIVSILQKQIMSGTIAPGSKLPTENDLASSFKVNRTTLREALRRLEHLGLIEIRHGDGVYAKNYLESGNFDLIKAAVGMDKSNETFMNVLEVRLAVGPMAAARAAERRTEADLAELKQATEDEDLSTAERDLKVHQIIARASHNVVYIIAFNFFHQIHLEYGRLYYSGISKGRHTGTFHRSLYEAIRDQKPESAQQIMYQGLLRANTNFQKLLAGKP
jgi:GntR family transcriptional repressor for pyruvate dehydrogenase complex